MKNEFIFLYWDEPIWNEKSKKKKIEIPTKPVNKKKRVNKK